jgi:hypothetical protein
MALLTLNLPLSLGMSREMTLNGNREANNKVPALQFKLQKPDDISAFVTIVSSVSMDNRATWRVFDAQRCQGGPLNVLKGATENTVTVTVRVPDDFNVQGAIVKVEVTECTGAWILVSVGTVALN